VIDLGPEGGDGGGEIVAAGTPEDVVAVKKSYTGQFLAPVLSRATPKRKKGIEAAEGAALFLQNMLLKKLRPEVLRRRQSIRPPLRREVHQVPVWPHRIDVRLGAPEMKNFAIVFPEHMHRGLLIVVGLALATIILLKRRLVA